MQKDWYKSKGIWAGALAIVYSLYLLVTTGSVDFQTVMAFLTGLGFIGIRHAMKK